ncbi:MAG TPA: hypothetical protein VF184_10060, partial [Phycisphaeraceae bacterium]
MPEAAPPSLTPPEHDAQPQRARRWIVPAIVALISLAYYLTYWRSFLNLTDEGFLVNGALRVMDGQWPMVDFWAYIPGRYWLLASLFALGGASLTVERAMLVAMLCLRNALVFTVARRLLPMSWALVMTATLALAPGPWHKVFYALLMFAHLEATISYLHRPTAARAALMGAVAGVLMYFRHEYLAFGLAASGLAILASWWLEPKAGCAGAGPSSLRQRAGQIGAMLAAAMVTTAPLLTAYAMAGRLPMLLERLGPRTLDVADVVYDAVSFRPPAALGPLLMRHLTQGPNRWFLDAWFPWLAVGIAAAGLLAAAGIAWSKWRSRLADPHRAGCYLLTLAWSLMAAVKILKQPSYSSFLIAGSGLVLIAAALLHAMWRQALRSKGSRTARAASWGAALAASLILGGSWVSLLATVVTAPPPIKTGAWSESAGADTPLDLPTASLTLPRSEAQTLIDLVHEVQQRVPPSGTIFAYRQPMLYVLTQRSNPITLDNLVPPIVLPELAQQTAAAWRQHPPDLQVIDLDNGWTLTLLTQYPDDLRDAMFSGYRVAGRCRRYLLLERSPGSHAWEAVQDAYHAHR